jgi:hypothetical protein
MMPIAQLVPVLPENSWQLWGLVAWMIYMTIGKAIVIFQNHRLQIGESEIKKQASLIQKQTNGLVDSSIKAAEATARMEGELAGASKEQARIARKLALSDEVAANLASLKSNDGE